jgi:hypothetical protein
MVRRDIDLLAKSNLNWLGWDVRNIIALAVLVLNDCFLAGGIKEVVDVHRLQIATPLLD